MADAKQVADTPLAADADQFASLLQKQFKPKTDGARAEVERAVRTLAEQALHEPAVVSDDDSSGTAPTDTVPRQYHLLAFHGDSLVTYPKGMVQWGPTEVEMLLGRPLKLNGASYNTIAPALMVAFNYN